MNPFSFAPKSSLPRIFRVLCIFITLFSFFAMDTYSKVKVNGIWYDFDKTELTATVAESNYDYQGSIVIPEKVTYQNTVYTVKSIDRSAFDYNSGMTSLSIPKTVTFISGQAFRACPGLKKITVDSANPIYDSRDNCNGVIETASGTLVVGCRGSSIPNGVTRIGDYAYYGYETLSSIIIPNSVESIGDQAFFDCKSLTSVAIPASVINIGRKAFWDCEALSSINVDVGNPIYDSRNGCNAIIETISNTLVVGCKSTIIPEGIIKIDNYAFAGSRDMVSIDIPNSVKTLGDNAFYGCWSLNSIRLPEGVTKISRTCFGECTHLKSIIIPNSVTVIDNSAFSYCI